MTMRGWNNQGQFELSSDDLEQMQTLVPEHLRSGLLIYVRRGVRVGSFLEAVLTNDLFGAIGRADMTSSARLKDICMWIYNYTPMSCHGSVEKYEEWLREHSRRRQQARQETI